MTSHLARLLAAAALALVVGSTTAQAEDVGLAGCYGVGIVVCEPNVHVPEPYELEWSSMGVPVCAGTCTTVPVPTVALVPTGDRSQICVTYENDQLIHMACNMDSEETE